MSMAHGSSCQSAEVLHNESGASADDLPSSEMDLSEKELTPVLAQLMTLLPGNDQHPDVLWLYQWLTETGRSMQEFLFVVETLRDKVKEIMIDQFENYTTGNDIYILKTAAEAMASINPILEGDWEEIAWRLFLFNLDDLNINVDYGPASKRFSNWVISVVGDPKKCPNPDLRIHMLQLYRTVVKIDLCNAGLALESFMLATTFLDRDSGRDFIHSINEVVDCLEEFKKTDCLLEFSKKLVKNMKENKQQREQIILHDISHNYSMGLKIVSQPIEVNSLRAILRFICSGTADRDTLNESTSALYCIVKHFKEALQEPELIDITVKTIFEIMEDVINMVIFESHIYDTSYHLYDLNAMLDEFMDVFEEDDEAAAVDQTKVGQEIVRRYRHRISVLRSLVSQEYPSPLTAMILAKLKLGEAIADIVFNNEWYKSNFADMVTQMNFEL